MNIVPTNFTVADYCQAMIRGEIVINREYQRSDKVWPPAARSFLIETVLLGYPIPKLSLYQVTDLKSRKTYKEIVDGQQRSMAIRDFFEDKLRLPSALETEDVVGKTYLELDDTYKQRFLDYSLSADVYVAATTKEVREVFRRMNSYTVPLNPEEERHAVFQGNFKWFIRRLSKNFDESFVSMGVFGEKQLVRMADTKLFTEICHAVLNGIQTTNKRMLDKVYEEKDRSFPEEKELEGRIGEAIDQMLEWSALHNGLLMKPYIVYSLILAMAHMKRSVASFQGLYPSKRARKFDNQIVLANLTLLSEALEESETPSKFEEFITACSSRTNVREQRERRFVWLCRALNPEML